MPLTDAPAFARGAPTRADPRVGVSLRFGIGLGASLVLHGLLFGLLMRQPGMSGAPTALPASTLLVEWHEDAPTPPAPPPLPAASARRASPPAAAASALPRPIPVDAIDAIDAASGGPEQAASTTASGGPDEPQELDPVDATASASAPAPSATDAYLWDVLAHLRRFQRYPEQARRDGLEGTVWLRARVSRQGEVLRAEVERSSGHDPLDAAAARLIARASPLPPPPAGAFAITDLRLPVEYRLQRE